MGNDLRWSKFWWADWQGDTALRLCGFAARGLWIDMLALMHDATPRGHLVINGKAATPRQLAMLTGGTEREVSKLLSELEEAGVFSRTDNGVIYSRRMVRDQKASEEGRANGKAGGNPNLKSRDKAKLPGGDNGGGQPGGLTQGDKLEAEAEAEAEAEESAGALSPRARGEAPRQRGMSEPERARDAAFEEWWLAYPRRVGKHHARRGYMAALAKGATPADLLTALRRQRWSSDPRYIPHPATWLNGGRWQDDPGAAAPPERGRDWPGGWIFDEMRQEAEEAAGMPYDIEGSAH